MTVSSNLNRASYTTSNATTHSFAYSFKIFADADLTVIVRSTTGVETTKTLGTNYIVNGAGSSSGGTVFLNSTQAPHRTAITQQLIIGLQVVRL